MNQKPSDLSYFHLKYILQALKPVRGNILDVGCGWGTITAKIAEKRPDLHITACDNNPKWITYVPDHFRKENITLNICDAQQLPYKNKQFDAVIMTDVLEHLPHPQQAIQEIGRVLKKKGIFHLAVPLEAEFTTYDGWIKLLFRKNLKEKPIGHIQQFKKKQIEVLLKKNDFVITQQKYSHFLFYQTLGLFYFLFLHLSKNGKYVPLHKKEEKRLPLVNHIKNQLITIIGIITALENFCFANIPGRTLHLTCYKK
jgi:ubiquinone/menaquinone biosynthesis C-methylase UbiE